MKRALGGVIWQILSIPIRLLLAVCFFVALFWSMERGYHLYILVPLPAVLALAVWLFIRTVKRSRDAGRPHDGEDETQGG